MAGIIEIENAEKFTKTLQDVGSHPAVIHFWADWAPQCQQITDVLQEFAKDTTNTNVFFIQVEAEKVPDVSSKYEIAAVPTCVLLRDQAVTERINGANIPELSSKIDKLVSSSEKMGGSSGKPLEEASNEDLDARLKKLISAAPVMVFMKGTPTNIQCGFSKKIVGILNEKNITYSSFNILADEDVRQGLKAYSNWPTYPQLYVSGELIGGVDIVSELAESGELKSMIPAQQSLEDRLKSLINKDKVMLFMKGEPSAPRCGFSKTTVEILRETGISYSHFDILTDEGIRQGLKTYSNWPTYPQLYVNGELIGGVDIIKELKENGELESTLQGH